MGATFGGWQNAVTSSFTLVREVWNQHFHLINTIKIRLIYRMLACKLMSFLTGSVVSADELNGYRRDFATARSQALLTLEKGWWKPVLIMALFGLIPVVAILHWLAMHLRLHA